MELINKVSSPPGEGETKHSPLEFVELTVLVYGLVWSFKILSYQTVRKLNK
jgi:hypothetical protein